MLPICRCVLSLTTPFVARSETRRLDVYACVSLRPPILSFLSIRCSSSHTLTAIAHRRVAIVDYIGQTRLDCFVKPTLPVSDYRTNVTGILPEDLESGECGASIFHDSTSRTDASTPYVLQMMLSPLMTPKAVWHPLLPTP